MSDYDIASQRRLAKDAFHETRIRQAFVRKVCFILMVQLSLTLGGMAVANTEEDVKLWLLDHKYLMIFALCVVFSTMCLITCCKSLSHEPPCNYLLLAIFTAAETFLLSLLTCLYPSGVVLMAVGTTAAVVFALTLFALQTKIDFTAFAGAILIFGVIVLLFSLVVIFFPSKILIYVKAAVGAVLASVFLVFDIQAIVGGEGRSMVLSPDDYVLAALCVYTDIAYMFLEILTLLRDD